MSAVTEVLSGTVCRSEGGWGCHQAAPLRMLRLSVGKCLHWTQGIVGRRNNRNERKKRLVHTHRGLLCVAMALGNRESLACRLWNLLELPEKGSGFCDQVVSLSYRWVFKTGWQTCREVLWWTASCVSFGLGGLCHPLGPS